MNLYIITYTIYSAAIFVICKNCRQKNGSELCHQLEPDHQPMIGINMDINTSNNPNLVLHKYQVASAELHSTRAKLQIAYKTINRMSADCAVARLQIQAAQEILANSTSTIISDLLAYAASLLSDMIEDGEEWS